MTERRAAGLGLFGALVLVAAQFSVGAAWSLTHEDPDELALTKRCLEREKGLVVESTSSGSARLTGRPATLAHGSTCTDATSRSGSASRLLPSGR